jgi:hypothetical protein
MSIPDFQTVMLPVLDVHADRKDWGSVPLRDAVAARSDSTAAERAKMLQITRRPPAVRGVSTNAMR